MKPPVYLLALLLCANQWQYLIYLKIDDESLSLFVALVDRAAPFAPELIDEVAILYLFDLGQVESLPRVPGALLHEKIGGTRIGLKVLMHKAIGHDKSRRFLVYKMRPGINCHSHFPFCICRCNYPFPFCLFKIVAQRHADPPAL